MTKIALITGASRGLGYALATALAPSFHIVAVARTVGALEELDDRIRAAGGQATLAPMDVTDDGAMQHLCHDIHTRWGGIDLWAHTAVYAPPLSPVPHVGGKDWDRAWATNVDATRRMIGYVTPLWRDTQAGRALFFDDPRGGEKFFGGYGATKAAQMALARSWAAECIRTGPRVSILAPAPMPTATRARFYPGEDRSVLAAPEDEARRLLGDLDL